MTSKKTVLSTLKLPFWAAILLLAGCAKQDFYRTEGLSLDTGDAIARNTALQVIDPWPQGVEDPRLLVPAEHGRPAGSDTPATPTAPKP